MRRNPSPLGQLLVAPQQQLRPQQARNQSVAIPHALPQGLRYGNVPPGIAQSQRFTGATAQQQPVAQINPPPDFVPPSYSNPQLTGGYSGGNTMGVHPIIAALATALGLGAAGGAGHPAPPPNLAAQQSAGLPRETGAGYLGHGGVPVLPGPTPSPAPPGSGYLTQSGTPSPVPGRTTGTGFLGPTGTPQAGLAAVLAAVGKRGAYQV